MTQKSIIILILLSTSLIASAPSWFIESTLPTQANEYIGYGSGKSKAEAQENAKSDISNAIQSTVRSSLSIHTTQEDDEYSRNMDSKIESFSSVELSDVKLIKSELVDETWYVALKYVSLPFAKKVRQKFDDITSLPNESNQYLQSTLLLKELKQEFGFYPKISIDRNIVTIADLSFPMSSATLKKLFSSKMSRNITLEIPKKAKHGEFYFINIKAKQKAYMTLIQIYENGESSLLFDNQKVLKDQKVTFPDPEEYNGLEAYLNEGDTRSKDMTIVVLCDEYKDFSYFDYVSTSKQSYAKVYGKIFDMIDGCDTASKIMNITR